MQSEVHANRKSQVVAWVVASLFVLGFFLNAVGAWTQPILGVWFVGTQKPRRGFLWLLAFAFIPSLLFGWRKVPLTGAGQALAHAG
jgi:surface polysaccharide O-acyltransferase-like enzyme